MSKLKSITKAIQERSSKTREKYLLSINQASANRAKNHLGCANLAHAYATLPQSVKDKISQRKNIAIISSYNDVLSAHEPYKDYPELIKRQVFSLGHSAQVASCVPAMCDGITQGTAAMGLSLFSRDVIALSTAIGLSHNTFDGALLLGVCDKIVPGLLIGALRFGHLAAMFLPSGPMQSKLSNSEKSRAREAYAQGEISYEKMLETEMKMYHGAGTCTFYGTANSNQVMLELLGLHMPNSAFINPHSALRKKLLEQSVEHFANSLNRGEILPLGQMIDERSIVNAIVGLLATGGSTNHTLHLVAIARAAGIIINWDDFEALSQITPLLAKIYPNGSADVNEFYEAGGLGIIIRELLELDLLHEQAASVVGNMRAYTKEPVLKEGKIVYEESLSASRNEQIIASRKAPFSPSGGLRVMSGNIGRSIIKISALEPQHRYVKAKAIVFHDQNELMQAFNNQLLECDFVAVLPLQGPKAAGMPELHKLITPLGALQNRGFKVALITDGRLSGASGKVPAAIHTSPEALLGGAISCIKTGDLIEFDAENGRLNVLQSDFAQRVAATATAATTASAATAASDDGDFGVDSFGYGLELFRPLQTNVRSAEEGASAII